MKEITNVEPGDWLSGITNRRGITEAFTQAFVPAQYAQLAADTVAELKRRLPEEPAYASFLAGWVNAHLADVSGLAEIRLPELWAAIEAHGSGAPDWASLAGQYANTNVVGVSPPTVADPEGLIKPHSGGDYNYHNLCFPGRYHQIAANTLAWAGGQFGNGKKYQAWWSAAVAPLILEMTGAPNAVGIPEVWDLIEAFGVGEVPDYGAMLHFYTEFASGDIAGDELRRDLAPLVGGRALEIPVRWGLLSPVAGNGAPDYAATLARLAEAAGADDPATRLRLLRSILPAGD